MYLLYNKPLRGSLSQQHLTLMLWWWTPPSLFQQLHHCPDGRNHSHRHKYKYKCRAKLRNIDTHISILNACNSYQQPLPRHCKAHIHVGTCKNEVTVHAIVWTCNGDHRAYSTTNVHINHTGRVSLSMVSMKTKLLPQEYMIATCTSAA